MKKKLGYIFAIFAFLLLTGSFVNAQVSNPNFWKRAGNAVTFLNSSWELGSSSSRIAKGWFTNLDVTNLTVSGFTGMTQGSILFAGSGGALSQDNANLFWDDTNNRLGIGTATPTTPLHVASSNPAGVIAIINNTSASGYGTLLRGGATDGSTYAFAVQNQASTDLLRITGSGNVSIGTSAPLAKLHIYSSSSGVTPTGDADELFLESSGNTGMTIGSSTSGLGTIYFGDSGNALIGRIVYNHNGDSLATYAAGSEVMRMYGSGTVNVGAKLTIGNGLGGGIGTSTLIVNNAGQGDVIGAVIKGYSSQTVNLTEWQNSSGTVLANVTAAGLLYTTSSVQADGNLTSGSGAYIAFGTNSRLYSPSNGTIKLSNQANNDFTSLQFGGTTSSFPALKRSATSLFARLADDSGYAPFRAYDLEVVSNRYLLLGSNSSGTGGGILNSPSDGVIKIENAGLSGSIQLNFGGSTSSFPAIKRSSAQLHFRLADDSGFADVQMGQAIFGGSNGYIGINNSISIDTTLRNIRAVTGQSPLAISTGEVAIGTTSTTASAIFEISSTTRGFLPPRMTTTQKNNISSPATGLMVYDTTLNKLCVYTGSAWETITSL